MMEGKGSYKLRILSPSFQADEVKEKDVAGHSLHPGNWGRRMATSLTLFQATEWVPGLATESIWNQPANQKQTKKRDRREQSYI